MPPKKTIPPISGPRRIPAGVANDNNNLAYRLNTIEFLIQENTREKELQLAYQRGRKQNMVHFVIGAAYGAILVFSLLRKNIKMPGNFGK